MKKLAIIGASGHGKVVADAALCSGWESIVFFDERDYKQEKHFNWPLSKIAELMPQLSSFDGVVVAIGNNQARMSWYQKLLNLNAPLVSIIHPTASISPYAEIGIGSVIFAHAAINPAAILGMGCIINTLASVDHDCTLGQGVHMSPGAHLAGNVSVGDLTWIGIGACVKEGIKIGQQVMVAAGAAVVRDIENNQTVMGVPAVVWKKIYA